MSNRVRKAEEKDTGERLYTVIIREQIEVRYVMCNTSAHSDKKQANKKVLRTVQAGPEFAFFHVRQGGKEHFGRFDACGVCVLL